MSIYPILLKQADNSFTSYTIFSKNSIKNQSVQFILRKYHEKRFTIKCGCNEKMDLWLSVVKNKDFYYLRRYPNSNREHNIDCIFNTNSDNLMKIDNNGSSKYSPRILEDTLNTKQTQKKDNDKSQRKIEHGIRNTFYSYCSELISESCIYAFNYVNYKYTMKDFRNFTYKEFLPRFRDVMGRTKLFGYKNVKEFCEKNSGYSFRYGIIDKDLAHLIKYSNCDNEDDIYEIGLCNNPISLKVSMRRLKIAMNRVKIFDNYTAPPYFFIAPTYYGKATRLYLHPVYFNNKYLCFVESALERDYAKKLFLDNIPFIKPIDNSELFKIKKEKIVPPGQTLFNLSHRPDFIEFNNEKITIVELSGNISSEYEEQLVDKEKDYFKITKNNSYVLYKRI